MLGEMSGLNRISLLESILHFYGQIGRISTVRALHFGRMGLSL